MVSITNTIMKHLLFTIKIIILYIVRFSLISEQLLL